VPELKSGPIPTGAPPVTSYLAHSLAVVESGIRTKINYVTWRAIRVGVAKKLMPAQLAESLELDIKTVRR